MVYQCICQQSEVGAGTAVFPIVRLFAAKRPLLFRWRGRACRLLHKSFQIDKNHPFGIEQQKRVSGEWIRHCLHSEEYIIVNGDWCIRIRRGKQAVAIHLAVSLEVGDLRRDALVAEGNGGGDCAARLNLCEPAVFVFIKFKTSVWISRVENTVKIRRQQRMICKGLSGAQRLIGCSSVGISLWLLFSLFLPRPKPKTAADSAMAAASRTQVIISGFFFKTNILPIAKIVQHTAYNIPYYRRKETDGQALFAGRISAI